MPQIVQILVLTFKIFCGACPQAPKNFLFYSVAIPASDITLYLQPHWDWTAWMAYLEGIRIENGTQGDRSPFSLFE